MIKNLIPLSVLVALPVCLQSCAPKAQTNAYGENVSFYFNSSATCPDHVPKWRQLDEKLVSSTRDARDQGDASGAFEQAITELGSRTSAAIGGR